MWSTALRQTLTRSFLCNKSHHTVGARNFKLRHISFLCQNEKFLVPCIKLLAFLGGVLRSDHTAEIMSLICMPAINIEKGKLYTEGNRA